VALQQTQLPPTAPPDGGKMRQSKQILHAYCSKIRRTLNKNNCAFLKILLKIKLIIAHHIHNGWNPKTIIFPAKLQLLPRLALQTDIPCI
jgi:hypothetical protein